MSKDSMRTLEDLINFIEGLIARKISFWSQFGSELEEIEVWGLKLNFESFNCETIKI
jgi:hypothetical protein